MEVITVLNNIATFTSYSRKGSSTSVQISTKLINQYKTLFQKQSKKSDEESKATKVENVLYQRQRQKQRKSERN